MKNAGILTGGGDCPGLNAVIRAATLRLDAAGWRVHGVMQGWRGMIERRFMPLDRDRVGGIIARGGTILKTSRTNPFASDDDVAAVLRSFEQLDALIAIGGEDTLGVAARLYAQHGCPIVGVPKTIDNDLGGTDRTFGFDTAVQIATDALDRLHTTAESHNRVMVVEVMGRSAGWIAIEAGLAAAADVILIPEFPLSVDQCADLIRRRHQSGKDSSIIVVSEGWPLPEAAGAAAATTDAFGHVRLGGVGQELASQLERITGYETRVTTLGHVQRGGTPTAFDRVLASRFGLTAADLVQQTQFGQVAALRGTRVVAAPLSDVVEVRRVPREYYQAAEALFA